MGYTGSRRGVRGYMSGAAGWDGKSDLTVAAGSKLSFEDTAYIEFDPGASDPQIRPNDDADSGVKFGSLGAFDVVRNGGSRMAVSTVVQLGTTTEFRPYGGMDVGPESKDTSSPQTVGVTDLARIAGSGTAAITYNLPAASGASGMRLTVLDGDNNAGTNNITVAPNGSDNLDGANASKALSSNGGAVELLCDGTEWFSTSSKGTWA